MRSLRRRVREYDVTHWARTFLDALQGEPATVEPELDREALSQH
jgi:trehalose-6-phosphate synthase